MEQWSNRAMEQRRNEAIEQTSNEARTQVNNGTIEQLTYPAAWHSSDHANDIVLDGARRYKRQRTLSRQQEPSTHPYLLPYLVTAIPATTTRLSP